MRYTRRGSQCLLVNGADRVLDALKETAPEDVAIVSLEARFDSDNIESMEKGIRNSEFVRESIFSKVKWYPGVQPKPYSNANSFPVVPTRREPRQSSSPPSISSARLIVTSFTFKIVYRCLLLTVLTLLCLLFVFSLNLIGSLSVPSTTARHTNSRSSR